MARKCDICAKQHDSGNRRSHAMNKTKCRRKANLQKLTVPFNGNKIALKICTKCRRTLNKTAA